MTHDTRYRPLNTSISPQVENLVMNRDSHQKESFLEEMLQAMIEDAISASASDIHLDPGEPLSCLRMRVDGELLDVCLIPPELAHRIVNHFKVKADLDPGPTIISDEGWVNYTLDNRTIHLRLSCAPTVSGNKMSIRIFDDSQVFGDIHDLGMTRDQAGLLQDWLESIQGLFLVVGSVGCGKSTTLYALLNQLRKKTRSVVTIEDPVEYRIEGINQIQVSEDTGLGFSDALKSVIRLDPDHIMLGEIRDTTSAVTAVDAAATGKVLISTLHSRDAVGAVSTLRNYGIKDHEIAALLEIVVAQRLVRKLCDSCKQETPVSENDRAWIESVGCNPPETLYGPHPEGCEACNGVGYKGRVGVFEVWRLREKEKDLLIQHPAEQVMRKQVREWGLPSLFDSGWDLVTSGKTSLDEIRPLSAMAVKSDE